MSNSGADLAGDAGELAQLSPPARLLEVARDLFCRNGIHATGIDRILAEANVSKMTLYTRYGSKEALLRAVLQREGEDWRARLFAALDAPATPLAQLEAIVPALRGWFESGRFYGCAFMNAVAEHPKSELWLRELAAEHHREILSRFSAIAEAAGFAAPATLARQLLLLIDGGIAALMVSGDPSLLDVVALNVKAILSSAPRIQED
jgi:AcrR family transcriptional regulator